MPLAISIQVEERRQKMRLDPPTSSWLGLHRNEERGNERCYQCGQDSRNPGEAVVEFGEAGSLWRGDPAW